MLIKAQITGMLGVPQNNCKKYKYMYIQLSQASDCGVTMLQMKWRG